MRELSIVVVVIGLFSTAVAAQATPDVSDEVRTLDGGRLRGVIVEDDPDSHVTIMLPDGTLRRVERAEIVYAGVVEAPAPTPPTPAPPISSFESDDEDLRLFEVNRDGPPSELCALPCSLPVPPGSRRFAIARGESQPVTVRERFDVTGAAHFRVDWIDHSALRISGGIILAVGGLLGLSIAIVGLATKSPCAFADCLSMISETPSCSAHRGRLGLRRRSRRGRFHSWARTRGATPGLRHACGAAA
jgi:hypothetical protein